jgi:hypothetical protein
MATLAEFLERLFGEGRVAFCSPPAPAPAGADRAEAIGVLRRAFAEDLMELAGPPLAIDEAAALAAAEWTRRACWFLASRAEPPEVVEEALELPPPPGSAAAHLSADLTFRYLPGVLRRARAIDPADVLAARLAEVLRAWPLSGAMADVPGPPSSPTDFLGHDGLMLRFAERLAGRPPHREAPGWIPAEGRARAYSTLVLDAMGRRPLSPAGDGDGDEAGMPRGPQIGGASGGRG